MILNSVKLHNIRSYIDEEITFPKGSVLLSGDIGCGKSSILLAVEFAMFGILPGIIEGEALLRNGKSNGFVEIDFSVDGQHLIVRRNLKRLKDSVRQDSGYLIVDNMKYELTPNEIKARILEILGYPKELITKSKALIYRYTVYTPQEAMKHILFEQPDIRLDVFRRVFQIDKYRRINQNCSIVLQSINEKKKVLNVQVSDLEDIKAKKAKLEDLAKQTRISLAAVLPSAQEFEQKILEKQNAMSSIEQKIKELNELKTRISTYSAMAAEKNKQILGSHSEMKKLYEDTLIIEKKLESCKNSIPLFLARVAAMQVFLAKADGETERAKNMSRGITELEMELQQLNGMIKENELLISQSEHITHKIKELDNCPLCLQRVLEPHKMKIYDAENGKISAALKILQEKMPLKIEQEAAIKQLKLALEKSNEKEKRAAHLKGSLRHFEALIEELQLEDELKNYIDFKETSFDDTEVPILMNLQQQLKEYNHLAALINDKKNAKKALEEKIMLLRKELSEIEERKSILDEKARPHDDIESNYQKIKMELNEAIQKSKEIISRKAALEKEEEYIMKNIAELADEISKKTKFREELNVIVNLQNWLQEYFINLMGVIERHVMLKIHQEFTELFQNWFSILMEGEILTARLDEDFTPIIMQDGYEISVEHLSGGEKTSCALAYRLALNKVINDMISGIKTKDIIILDEPTDGFSSEQLDKVRDVIKQLNMNQIIIVSHEAKVESFVDSIIKIGKREHVSRVEG